jgi:tRNA dimethylallyltransferase
MSDTPHPGKPMVHIVTGTTGSGKTTFAVELAGKLNGELINADSRQVYKYLPIGTNLEPGVEIHLTALINPDEHLDVYRFRRLALSKIAEVFSRGKVPIIVGGTGMYIDSLLHPEKYSDDLSAVEQDEVDNLRRELGEKTLAQLQEMLTQLAPDSINQINSSDWRNPRRLISRIIRTRVASEENLANIDNLQSDVEADIAATQQYEYEVHYTELALDELKLRLEQRARAMWEAGIVPEVENVLALGFPRESTALQGIGFRQVLEYLDGAVSAETAIANIARAHFQYAKRQLTWFRKYLGNSIAT